jgi:hypothetical protein
VADDDVGEVMPPSPAAAAAPAEEDGEARDCGRNPDGSKPMTSSKPSGSNPEGSRDIIDDDAYNKLLEPLIVSFTLSLSLTHTQEERLQGWYKGVNASLSACSLLLLK